MAELSVATQNNTEEITQSPVTVQTIVEILLRVADVSQNIIINQPVMGVCTLQYVCTKDIRHIVANQNFITIIYLYILFCYPV